MKPLTFSEEVKDQQLNTVNVALTNSKYPVSGSFIDVGNYERFVIRMAGGSMPDAVVAQIEQATAANGTPKDITGAVQTFADDNEVREIEVLVNKLDINNGYRYITVDVTGVSGSDYASLEFFGILPNSQPVTQPDSFDAVLIES